MPSQEPNRQELMNAGPHHAKLRVTAHMTAPVHVAGTDVTGKIDVECRAEKGLGLGTIMVELMAIQELNSRDHAATSTFIHTRRLFQGPGLPPSNAVLGDDETGAFPAHHYPARRGITSFFFRFPLPLTSPASVDFGSNLARIRYEIRASASVAWKGERRLVTDRQDIQVVESATQEVESAGTVVGESGKIWMQAKVLGGAVIAGQTCCIELHVKNHASRKTTGVNVSLRRVLHLDNPPPQHANLIVSDTLVTAPFNTAEYCCPPGVEGVAKLVINVPRTARTVKGGSRESGEAGSDKVIPALFDIRGSINVRLCMGTGAKDLSLDLPVVICHPAAIPPEPPLHLGLPGQELRPTSPHAPYEPPRSPFAPPHSPVQPHYTGYSPYPPSSPVPYTQVYFPPASPIPPNILNYFPAPPMSPALPMSPGPPMSPAPPFSPALPITPMLPPGSPYPNQVYSNQPYPNPFDAPRSPMLPYTPNMPQFAHAQSMPQLGPQQPPQRHDGLPARGPRPPLPPLPPRPASAEPHVHQVGIDLPPAAVPSSPAAARVLPNAMPNDPDTEPVEGKGARASRISEHLRMSSRTRSVSPTGRRFPNTRARPPPVEPPAARADLPKSFGPRPVPSPPSAATDRRKSRGRSVQQVRAKDLVKKVFEHGTESDVVELETLRAEQKSPQAIQEPAMVSTPLRLDDVPAKQTQGKVLPQLPPQSCEDQAKEPSTPHMPAVTPPSRESQGPAPVPAAPIPKPVLADSPVFKPLQPMSTGLTALERRLTTRTESSVVVASQPIRKPAQRAEAPLADPKVEAENTIDWGEIARIGKLKSFAHERKKPPVTSFSPPVLPPESFVKPKPVARKPIPSFQPEEIVVQRPPSAVIRPPSPPRTSQPPAHVPIPDLTKLMRYELSDPPVSKLLNNQPTTSATPRSSVPSSPTVAAPSAPPSSRPPASIQPVALPKSPAPPKPSTSPRPSASGLPTSPRHRSPRPSTSPRLSSSPQPSVSPRPSVAPGPSNPPRAPAPSGPPTSPRRSIQAQLPTLGQRPPQRPTPQSPRNQASATTTDPPQPAKSSVTPASQPVLTAPKHLVRYQLTDAPVPQLEPILKPASMSHRAPVNNGPNYRAALKPVSAARPSSPSKAAPRTAEQKRGETPSSTTPIPPRENPASRGTTPRVPSFPLPEPTPQITQQRNTHPAIRPAMLLPRRDPSPQRSRPQQPSQQSTTQLQLTSVGENKLAATDRPRTSEPQRLSAESQAAQKAKYFESLAAGAAPAFPVKPKPTPAPPRQILQPQEGNTSQARPEPPHIPHSQPPTQTRPTPRSLSSPIVGNPSIPREEIAPTFTAMPVSPTAPTARSLIPTTSSGFEVPAVLPGRDARERADAALREAELFRLKREAIGRVPMWLSSESTPQPPPPTRAIRPSGNEYTAYSHWDLQHPTASEPSMAELLAAADTPATRAVYDPQLKHPRPRPVSSKCPAALLPIDAELLAKYDVRSARGGKGGQVTAVASIWQNAVNPTTEAARPPPKQQASPAGLAPIVAKITTQVDRTIPSSPLVVSSRGIVKSTSIPTMVYPATAVPVLSSSASLARPLGGPGARPRQMTFPTSIPESQSDDTLTRRTSQPPRDIAVGQARLKELIGKYQS